MGSHMTTDNEESTCCGLVTQILYNSKCQAVGAKIRARLLEGTLPWTENGCTFHLLHALLCATKPFLQGLGLSLHTSFSLFDTGEVNWEETARRKAIGSETWKRFSECLREIGLSRAHTQALFEVLSTVILLFEVRYAGNAFVTNAGEEGVSWTPRHRAVVQKVCKLLGTNEEKFNACFSHFSSKSHAEMRMQDLARSLYYLAFEWLV